MPDETLASGPPREPPAHPVTIGRYTVEGVLGAGGMGIVYAAHDPDLERRVALKVLRAGRGETQGRARLLREARAMAKLSHPNVITVHEVGTDGDVDFVAMELIEGKNASEWLATRPPRDQVLRVLLAAGRGLAAAHRAGVVHRDFKPHNVLVGNDGRVVVTDFGLARAFDDVPAPAPVEPAAREAIALDVTMAATPPSKDAGSLSSTLTQTGAMLGTPAYMAPEQFAGSATGPATDQFAYCVALWEGLAGARPFRGDTIEELRRAVIAGVPRSDASLPRGLRKVIVRGLAREPAARWPSVDALLAAFERARKRPRRVALIAGIVAIAAVSFALEQWTRPDAPETMAACRPPEQALLTEVPPSLRAALEHNFGAQPAWPRLSKEIDQFFADWVDSDRIACKAPEAPEMKSRIACLQTSLDEMAALMDGGRNAPADVVRGIDLPDVIASPRGCIDGTRTGYPPLPDDAALRDQVSALRRRITLARTTFQIAHDQGKALAQQVVDDARKLPYRAVLAEALDAQGDILDGMGDDAAALPVYEEAATEADASGHRPMRAEALIGVMSAIRRSPPEIRAAADAAAAAIDGAGGDPVLHASVDRKLADLDVAAGDLDAAIGKLEHARQSFAAAGYSREEALTATREGSYLRARASGDDIVHAETLYREALATMTRVGGADAKDTHGIASHLASLLLDQGRVAEAHALWRDVPYTKPTSATRPIHGRVVDQNGDPVSNANVIAGEEITGDSFSIANPTNAVNTATSDAGGAFTIDATDHAFVIAQSGALRSDAVPVADGDVELEVRPTGTVAVTLHVIPPDQPSPLGDEPIGEAVAVGALVANPEQQIGTRALPDHGLLVMPLQPGRRVIRGAQVSRLNVEHVTSEVVEVKPGETSTATITVDLSGVALDVIVRADRDVDIPLAQIFLTQGHVLDGNVTVDRMIAALFASGRYETGEGAADDPATETDVGKPLYQPGDTHVRVTGVAPGPQTLCVLPLSNDVYAQDFDKRAAGKVGSLDAHCEEIDVPASPSVQAVVVEVPPMKRLE